MVDMAAEKISRFDRWVESAKNHKILSVIIFTAVALTGVVSFTESVSKIIKPFIEEKPTESSTPIKISKPDQEVNTQDNFCEDEGQRNLSLEDWLICD